MMSLKGPTTKGGSCFTAELDVEPSGDLVKLKGVRVWKSNWDSIFKNRDANRESSKKTLNLP